MLNKNILDYNKILLFILSSPFIASCGHMLIGQGTIELVDPSCNPITDKKINVNSIESAGFLQSGHLTKKTYNTDQRGQVIFDIEKSSDKMAIFLQGVNGEKEGSSIWNWYTTTSSNDEMLFFFNPSGPAQSTPYKDYLLSSSTKKPIVIVYPYKKDTCNNDNPDLNKYNSLKFNADAKVRNAEEKAAKAAAEKARIDAIKVIIPKYTVKAYGIIDYSIRNMNDEVYEIAKNSSIIKNSSFIKHKNLFSTIMFGVIVSQSETPVLKKPDDITFNIEYPDAEFINPSTGKTSKEINYKVGRGSSDKELVLVITSYDGWQFPSGEWIFRIMYKDSVLLEQSIIVE